MWHRPSSPPCRGVIPGFRRDSGGILGFGRESSGIPGFQRDSGIPVGFQRDSSGVPKYAKI